MTTLPALVLLAIVATSHDTRLRKLNRFHTLKQAHCECSNAFRKVYALNGDMNSFWWYRVAIFLLVEVSVVCGDLSSPQNLTLETLNTHYLLLWDWGNETAMNGTVTFTAQYLAQYKTRRPAHRQNWKSVCVDVVERHCDFSDAGLFYFGMFLLRVRAQIAQQSSRWIQIEFCPDKHADLGPPSSVKLNSLKEGLEITIFDPLDNNNQSMKELVQNMYYQIQYWKKYEDQKAEILPTPNNVATLSGLDRWTYYCIRVQSRCEFYNKSSVFSETHCTKTGGETTYLEIFLYFLLSLVMCLLLGLVLSLGCYKTYKTLTSIFYPATQLPVYIHEDWAADMPWLLIPESETVCEHLDITSEINIAVAVMDDNISEQDRGTDQHDSGDSGFNSTEEDSCHRHYGLTEHITCNDDQIEDMCNIKNKQMLESLCLKQLTQ